LIAAGAGLGQAAILPDQAADPSTYRKQRMKSRWQTSCSFLFSALLLVCAAAPAHAARNADLERYNKAVIGQFVSKILSDADAEVLARQVSPHVIQHDSTVQAGRRGTVDWIRALRQQAPAQTMTVKHILADGDMVFVHSQVSATPADEMSGTNRYDFYRLDRGWIVEHWVVQAPAPTRSASGNSAFSDLYVYATPPAPLSAARVEMNRLLVHTLADDVFGKRNFGLLDRLWGPDYIQHNPYIGNGRAALAGVMQYISPVGSHYRVVRSMADGDLSVVCSHNVQAGGDPANEFSGRAVCDIFRVVNFEMVEHWDVVQTVPTSSLNGNSMFSSLYRNHPHH
jgi:predicted SnoaL-like aldol condensation-catalyzing enzyme